MKHAATILLATSGSLLWLLGVGSCHAQDAAGLKQSFGQLAAPLAARYLHDGGPELTAAQNDALQQMRQLANQTAKQPDYADATLALLDQYKADDGWARQQILQAVLNDRTYDTQDLPFLKRLFTASLGYHYERFPYKIRGWYTALQIRDNLAGGILTLTGQPSLVHNPDAAILLDTNPASWLAKYAP